MKVTLSIEYHTVWGESLVLVAGDGRYPMEWVGNGIWSVTIENCTASLLSDYTYILMKDGLVRRTEWKGHGSTPAPEIRDSWKDCPLSGLRAAGTAVPIFALRSGKDFGIGDFRDLRLLVDWAAATGQSIIQLLPVNDTVRKDGRESSYPYSPISSFALNPLYIRLQDLGIKEDEAFLKKQKELNSLSEIDFPKVFRAKMSYIRKAYRARGAEDTASPAFRRFCENNAGWLEEYTAFCAERDSKEKEYYAWIQFHLDRQLSEEVAYAHRKHIYLKGDLPIGVSRDSAECHFHPELFNLDSNAGAPPDRFSATGQNWKFPTYNWEKMAEDNYSWWKARLRKMSEYFDAFRIDHILGFFRIWEIPAECESGLEGHFNPALSYSLAEIRGMGLPTEGLFHEDPHLPGMFQPLIRPDIDGLPECQRERFNALYEDFYYHRNERFWEENALRKLPHLLGATGMLACGEDLGMVPECVPAVMERERILSLRMRTMEGPGPWREMSVCATSSHDMETLRMQFDKDPEPSECRSLLMEYLGSPSRLAIFPLQDWMSLDGRLRRADRNSERINNPAASTRNWRYRFHFPMEKLTCSKCRALNSAIAEMLDGTQRRPAAEADILSQD